ncbi:MAG: ATP-binding cassette domain-containing protein [Methanomicrobiales archaeon]|jgi:cobalt/nickel transport system ATP-binding protein|nr:ATP-binding cassette domain-containing protein [Methanomicrobiales archaeon]
MSIIIEARDVRYTYPGGIEAIKGISFHIRQGEKIALVGPNGAGKSTLLQMCNGMIRPSSGTMLVGNTPIKYNTRSLCDIRRRVGFVLQNSDRQIIAPTVYQDVAFGPTNLGYDKQTVQDLVEQALQQVGLTGLERRPPYQLSGGEKKRVAIAGILAMDPDVLIFDEPTSGLDPAGSEELMDLLDELHHDGKTIIISTHDLELVYPWAERAILLLNGKILEEDVPEVAFGDPTCVRLAHLSLPVLLELSQELTARGILPTLHMPKTILDMIHIIESQLSTPPSKTHGSIWVYDVDKRQSTQDLMLHVQETKAQAIGAMGTRAKQCMKQAHIPLDFSYGVIDKSILRALRGEDTFIATSNKMVARIQMRIDAYNQESKNNIKVEIL